MKIKIKFFVFAAVIFLSNINLSFSQVPTYTLTAKNFQRISPDSMVFQIYLLHTNPGTSVFQYPAGQYFFKFNPLIANGGTLRYRIIGTSLPSGAVPQSASVSGSELRLASNLPVPQATAPIISSTENGTLIVKMSLRTTASSFDPNQPLNLTWKNTPEPGFVTKISAYVGTFIQEVTTPITHFADTTTVSINQISTVIPAEFKIFQNYPNPFNPSTKIKFDVPNSLDVKFTVFDITGKEIEILFNGKLSAGSYEFKWDASKFSSGIYFYRIQSQDFVETKRMILLK